MTSGSYDPIVCLQTPKGIHASFSHSVCCNERSASRAVRKKKKRFSFSQSLYLNQWLKLCVKHYTHMYDEHKMMSIQK